MQIFITNVREHEGYDVYGVYKDMAEQQVDEEVSHIVIGEL